MSVTPSSKSPGKSRKIKRLKRPAELKELADFLNHDFDQDPKTWRAPGNPLFFLHLKATQPDLNEVRSIQEEMSKDLAALIAPECLGDLDISIDRLIDKINGLNIVNKWDGLPYGDAWISLHGGLRWSDQAPASHPVRTFDRVVRIAGFKWILRKTPVANSLRSKVYQIVMETLETDTFSNLRKCKQCLRFFAARDAREEVCAKCRRSYVRMAAKSRGGKHRRKIKDQSRDAGLRLLRQITTSIQGRANLKLGDLLDESPNLTTLRLHLGGTWEEFRHVLDDLRSKTLNVEEGWNSLSARLKEKLAHAPWS